MRPALTQCQGKRVIFEDGSKTEADTIIFCTGYQVEFPFFDSTHLCAPENVLPLYLRAFHPEHHHVFFVGLLQTVGAVMPVAEAQAQAIALHLAGHYNLPSAPEMRLEIQRHDRVMQDRFVASRRHTMQVIITAVVAVCISRCNDPERKLTSQ